MELTMQLPGCLSSFPLCFEVATGFLFTLQTASWWRAGTICNGATNAMRACTLL